VHHSRTKERTAGVVLATPVAALRVSTAFEPLMRIFRSFTRTSLSSSRAYAQLPAGILTIRGTRRIGCDGEGDRGAQREGGCVVQIEVGLTDSASLV